MTIDESIVIATRNRPDDLRRLLASLGEQSGMQRREVVLVDASDEGLVPATRELAERREDMRVRHVRYAAAPSAARQRNAGLDTLDADVRIVHFMDDDVTLEPGCLDLLTAAFERRDVGGVGGCVLEGSRPGESRSNVFRRLFLLDSTRPGRVLVSGSSSAAQTVLASEPFETDWLGGCASYRRELLEGDRFDERLEGHSLDEDIDLSYRLSRRARLLVVPDARINHHTSSSGRLEPDAYIRDFVVHRYWFLEKNVRHPLRKPAFWWAMLGRLLATSASRQANGRQIRDGLVSGALRIWRRDHPLLATPPSGS